MSGKTLDLPLKAKWYYMQESGEKTEEYREITPFWCNRLLGNKPFGIRDYWNEALENIFKSVAEYGTQSPSAYNLQNLLIGQHGLRNYTNVKFRFGYTSKTFTHKIDSITIGYGKPEWGAPNGREVFIIKHS